MEQISIAKLGNDLKSSENTVGQLYPILRDSEGKVIDGWHRLDANPDWKSVTLKEVKTEEERLIISAHVNIGRRNISRHEKRSIVNELAEIYYKQGLRPDTLRMITDKNGVTSKRHYNEIKHKISESLNGIMTPNLVKGYLDIKYLNSDFSKAKKNYNIERHETSSPYALLKSSHGKVLRKVYGMNFFKRLESEMFDKALTQAKEYLRSNDSLSAMKFRNIIRKEVEFKLRSEYRENIRKILSDAEDKMRISIRAEVEAELGLVVVSA